jgi:lipoprotein-releasing system ATP-binding protein
VSDCSTILAETTMIKVENIFKSFGNLKVLNDVSLNIARSEVVSIVGPSGAGKTTLLQIMGTLSRQDSGRVLINGIDVSSIGDKKLSKFRNLNIGFVFQFHNLLGEFTAFENVCIPAFIAGSDRRQTEAKATELLKMLGMQHRMNHKPSEMSGGEQQRVAIARALINSPSLLLADEPSGNLDTRNRDELHSLFFDLRDKLGQTIVIVTHDNDLAQRSDRKIVMIDGQITK